MNSAWPGQQSVAGAAVERGAGEDRSVWVGEGGGRQEPSRRPDERRALNVMPALAVTPNRCRC